jgi:hypothetical protein
VFKREPQGYLQPEWGSAAGLEAGGRGPGPSTVHIFPPRVVDRQPDGRKVALPLHVDRRIRSDPIHTLSPDTIYRPCVAQGVRIQSARPTAHSAGRWQADDHSIAIQRLLNRMAPPVST